MQAEAVAGDIMQVALRPELVDRVAVVMVVQTGMAVVDPLSRMEL
jgi:hypothetical protein